VTGRATTRVAGGAWTIVVGYGGFNREELPMRVHPLARRRTIAYAADCMTYLGIAAATVPVGLIIRQVADPSRNAVLTMSAVPPLVATVWAAARESGLRRATWGKRRQGLTFATYGADGAAPTFARALLRNTVKIAIPWQLGHMTAIGAAWGGFDENDPLTVTATVLTYPVIGALVLTTVLGSGRAVHDRVARTVVVEAR
jgi:uncharacterized RDD family membrane protein YckC